MSESITARVFDLMLAQQRPPSRFIVREDTNGRDGQFYVLEARYANGTGAVLGYHSSRAMAEDFGRKHIDFIAWLKGEQPGHPWLRDIGETP